MRTWVKLQLFDDENVDLLTTSYSCNLAVQRSVTKMAAAKAESRKTLIIFVAGLFDAAKLVQDSRKSFSCMAGTVRFDVTYISGIFPQMMDAAKQDLPNLSRCIADSLASPTPLWQSVYII